MTMRISAILLLACILLPHAQAQNGTTIASRYGIGELSLTGTIRQRGMGGVAAPLLSAYDLSMANPASWTGIGAVRLQGALNLEQASSDLSDARVTTHSAGLASLMFALPISTEQGWTLALGFHPLSRTNFSTDTRGSEQGEGYLLDYASSGGISVFQLGFSFRPFMDLHLGATYNYNFGTISRSWNITFDNGTYFNGKESRDASHNGSTATFGAIYTGVKNFSIGAALTTGTGLRASQDALYSYITHDSTLTGGSATIDLPLEYSLGVSWTAGDNLLAAAEYSDQDWSGTLLSDQPSTQFGHRRRISAGVEYSPSHAPEESFFRRALYRLGFYRQTGYVAVGNTETTEFFLTAGFGFPIGGFTRSDIAFEYGWRGAASDPTGKDTIMRLSIGVSASELWFIRHDTED